MDKQLYVERMLETENLTDELEDPDAKWLLDWGIAQLDQFLPAIAEEETADEKVTALMSLLRKINRMVGSRLDKSPQALASDLVTLTALFTEVYGAARTTSDAEVTPAAGRLHQAVAHEALELLTGWGQQPGAQIWIGK